jgi:hypothetical protein
LPPDLFINLKVAWTFGGMTMLGLGAIVEARP